MRFLLAAVNAKYIHSNPAVYSLKAYAEKYGGESKDKEQNPGSDRYAKKEYANKGSCEIAVAEYTINHLPDQVLRDIYSRRPAAVGFSCYIWNLSFVLFLARELPKILPGVHIWLGGPEVSYNACEILDKEPEVYGIMAGEGEETFLRVTEQYLEHSRISGGELGQAFTTAFIEGTAVRDKRGKSVLTPLQSNVSMSSIPFFYRDLTDFENRIVYYESSRGCPFSCSYCLSSAETAVRFREVGLVLQELDFFLENKVLQVKFVDRTFNCNRERTIAIWRYILEHDNGVTNFHFEISADLLGEEELTLMSRMRGGLIQLEIGVQSTNPRTLQEIRRKTDLKRLKKAVERINSFETIHQHLDLIAGLPFEDYNSFRNSFNDVFQMKPDQLQLGFLKVLKGSFMAENAKAYGLTFQSAPPYEVLSTKWLDYGQLLKLKDLEEVLEIYGNSGQFQTSMGELCGEMETPFDLFEELAGYYRKQGLFDRSHNRMERYEILECFVKERFPEKLEAYRDRLVYDLYLRENLKSRPVFAVDQEPFKERIRAFFAEEAVNFRYLKEGYEGCHARQMIKMAHVEVFRDGRAVLFDYKKRNPLSHNAGVYLLGLWT